MASDVGLFPYCHRRGWPSCRSLTLVADCRGNSVCGQSICVQSSLRRSLRPSYWLRTFAVRSQNRDAFTFIAGHSMVRPRPLVGGAHIAKSPLCVDLRPCRSRSCSCCNRDEAISTTSLGRMVRYVRGFIRSHEHLHNSSKRVDKFANSGRFSEPEYISNEWRSTFGIICKCAGPLRLLANRSRSRASQGRNYRMAIHYVCDSPDRFCRRMARVAGHSGCGRGNVL